jgi:hypothetical protein
VLTHRTLVAAAGLALATGLWSPSARADEGAAALALFRAGREAMARGDFESACKRFRESARLERAPGTLLNLGECSERLGRLASAWSAYSEVGDRLPADDPRRDYARDKVAELSPRLARIQLRSGGAGERCTIVLDGTRVPMSAAEQPLPVDAGRRSLVLECEGRERANGEVVAIDGRIVEVGIEPGAKLRVEAPRDTRPPVGGGGSSPLIPVGWVLGGIGLASLGVGAATGVLTIDRKGTVDELCSDDPTPRCPPAGVDAASEGSSFATVSTATFIGGAALLAAGATLLVVGSSVEPDRPQAGDVSLFVRGGQSSEVVFRARF